uniref:Putative serine/threonine-protein kinase n=1 Tax=Lutzomyia longipalpis TaxID=7200 RepID=A0A1B0CQT3_LUTLO
MNSRVAQSASLYSMSSGSSCVSGVSNTSSCSDNSTTSGLSSVSSAGSHHKHNSSCPSGCLGAIPRNPTYQNRPTKGRERAPELLMRSRLPTIKEFRSPARRLPTPSPVHVSNPRLRYGTYTGKSTSPTDIIPLLVAEASSTAPPVVAKSLGVGSKVAPIRAKSPISGKSVSVKSKADLPAPSTSKSTTPSASSTAPGSLSDDLKRQEVLKKEEKARLKAEKEMKKEEKRIAKEEERLAKMLAKEEKKRRKKEGSMAKGFFG